MTKSRPILFSTPMVQAILNGTKTQTRRVVKPQPTDKSIPCNFQDAYKFGMVGDQLWVRETFAILTPDFPTNKYFYKADGDKHAHKWKPSIFMPREACRLHLEITEIKVERLQSISEEDAIAEGIESISSEKSPSVFPFTFKSYHVKPGKEHLIPCAPYVSFRTLWQKINGYESWDSNPFVWVIKFKKI